MNSVGINVSISPKEAADLVQEQIINGSMSGELIDKYVSIGSDSKTVIVLVFEKYYMRNSSRASLTVTIENISGTTKVRAVGSGGGQGLIFKFDWGAGSNFSDQVIRALERYKI